jgi:glucose/arabinose dehydrogenase
MHRVVPIGILSGLIAIVFGTSAWAAIAGLQRVANGLSSPIFATHAPDDRDRLFIVERGSPFNSTNASASIRILDLNTGQLAPTPFLTIPGLNNQGEGGLLGMAFHPDYANNGKFYVYATANDSIGGTPFSSYIREYTVSGNPNVANTTFNPILTWAQPQSNHNAGWIGFSPNDEYLYISSGDGGGGNDNGTGHTAGIGNAQDITNNLLGKMLRIDVGGDDFPADANRNYAIPATNPFVDATGDDEIWAYGLRNPFRNSFDRLTGDLWIGDVGQSAREEIDFQAADSSGGANYGWRLREGNIQTPSVGGPAPADYVPPVYDYNRDNDQFGGTVVSGGYVYRGPDPSLQGKYFFLDSRNDASTTNDNYWHFDPADPFGTVANIDSLLTPNTGTPQFPVSYGEDAKGNLYIVYIGTGEVYRIVTNSLLAGDYDADGDVDQQDYGFWNTNFGTTAGAGLAADGNGDGTVNAADYTVWRDNLGASVHNLGAGGGSVSVPEPTAAMLISLAAISTLIHRRRQATMDPSYTSRS